MMRFLKLKPTSLRAKILLVVLIVVFLNATLTALFLAKRLRDRLTAAARESMLSSLYLAEEKVLSELARRAEVTKNLAAQLNLLRDGTEASVRSLIANYLAQMHKENSDKIPMIQAAYIMSLKGERRLVCSGLDWTVADLEKRPWWRQTLRGEEPDEPLGTPFEEANILVAKAFVGDVRLTPGPATLPIYWVETEVGETRVVGIDFSADLSETPTGSTFPTDDLYGELADSHGYLLAVPSDGGHKKQGYRLFTNEAQTNPLLAKAVAAGPQILTGSLIYTGNKGVKVLGMYWRGSLGFIYIKEKPLSEVYGPVNREVYYVIWLSLVVAVAAAVLLTWFLMRGVVTPLHHLSQAMNRLGAGELSTRIPHRRRDEFGQLFKQFNSTAAQLQNQIRVAYVERLARRQAELEFLQAQINPHFLYNTLDCIYRLILNGDNKEGGQAIISLSKLFRLSLGRGPSVVTIAETLEQLNHYLELQRLRHGDRITAEVDVAPEILGCAILKLLLQPAVENAFVHGLEPKQGPGKLAITGRREGDTIHFIITDDGIGMSEEQLAKLHEAMADPSIQTSHGLANVHRRLILAYGDGCGVNIAPRPGGGLRVDISWPASNRKEEEGNPNV